MNIDILYRPAHSLAKVALGAGESIIAESGAMIGMSPNIDIKTTVGGARKGIGRLFGGESLFRNEFTAQHAPGEVLLAPSLCGDMAVFDTSTPWFVQSGSYVASAPGVDLNTKVGGFKTFFAGEGIFVLRASGGGQIIVGSFGALERIDISGSLVIDTGHLVAWPDTPQLNYRVTKAGGGWISSFLSGEGLVCEFTGTGSVWIQTRNSSEYGNLVGRMLAPR